MGDLEGQISKEPVEELMALLMSTNSEIPYILTGEIIVSILISGIISIYLSSQQSLKGNITQLLRDE